jgi:hypothetical protein
MVTKRYKTRLRVGVLCCALALALSACAAKETTPPSSAGTTTTSSASASTTTAQATTTTTTTTAALPECSGSVATETETTQPCEPVMTMTWLPIATPAGENVTITTSGWPPAQGVGFSECDNVKDASPTTGCSGVFNQTCAGSSNVLAPPFTVGTFSACRVQHLYDDETDQSVACVDQCVVVLFGGGHFVTAPIDFSGH